MDDDRSQDLSMATDKVEKEFYSLLSERDQEITHLKSEVKLTKMYVDNHKYGIRILQKENMELEQAIRKLDDTFNKYRQIAFRCTCLSTELDYKPMMQLVESIDNDSTIKRVLLERGGDD